MQTGRQRDRHTQRPTDRHTYIQEEAIHFHRGFVFVLIFGFGFGAPNSISEFFQNLETFMKACGGSPKKDAFVNSMHWEPKR